MDGIDRIPAIVSGLLAFCVALAMCHAIGYFVTIDAQLFTFITIQDALIDAARFIPIVAGASAIFAVMVGLTFPSRIPSAKVIAGAVVSGAVASMFGVWLASGSDTSVMSLVRINSVPTALVLAFGVTLIATGNARLSIIVAGTACALVASTVTGVERASGNIKSTMFPYTVKSRDQTYVAVLLRSGSNYTIIRTSNSKIVVIPASELLSVEYDPTPAVAVEQSPSK